jgi:glycosyltransferase involved in cell wall biosynthesis
VQWDNTAIERWLKDRTYARSKLTVIAPSRWLAGLARESILGRFPVHHLPYGIDTDVYRPSDRAAARRELALPPDKTVLMFGCAQLSETRKGMDLLVELLRALPEAVRAHCVLLTLGRPFPGLAELVALPTVQAGYVEDDTRKAAIYAAADIFISTTRADNLPLVLQESLACGTPMLATDVGGVGDIVRDGVTGFLVPPDRPVELAARLAELAGGENLRREMALRCRQIAVEEYGLEAVARRHLELYESLAEQVSAAQR